MSYRKYQKNVKFEHDFFRLLVHFLCMENPHAHVFTVCFDRNRANRWHLNSGWLRKMHLLCCSSRFCSVLWPKAKVVVWDGKNSMSISSSRLLSSSSSWILSSWRRPDWTSHTGKFCPVSASISACNGTGSGRGPGSSQQCSHTNISLSYIFLIHLKGAPTKKFYS